MCNRRVLLKVVVKNILHLAGRNTADAFSGHIEILLSVFCTSPNKSFDTKITEGSFQVFKKSQLLCAFARQSNVRSCTSKQLIKFNSINTSIRLITSIKLTKNNKIYHRFYALCYCKKDKMSRGNHSYTKVVCMLVIINVVQGLIFYLVAASKFLENRVLFGLSLDV